jgi:ubiquinone/menaquinone biosynthesis C-methylase UbiE
MSDMMKNPWLQISSEEYNGHMSAPNVMQLQMLNKIFEEVLDEYEPRSICVLGCTAGNGFEHLMNREIDRVVGIDINPKYVAECRAWFVEDVPNLQLICGDLNELELAESTFDFIHAALIFEYVNLEKILSKTSRWLKKNGLMCVVLQLSNENVPIISETEFASLKLLKPIMHLISPENFKELTHEYGLVEIRNDEEEIIPGKCFYVGVFEKI